jgi:branched-chain amino acid transport system permease protein
LTASAVSRGGPRRIGTYVRRTAFVLGLVAAYFVVLWVTLAVGDPSRASQAGSVALQQTVNALSIGAIYALIALGYTMVYGIIELINFAHGDVFMVGAFVSVAFISGVLGFRGPIDSPVLVIVVIVAAVGVVMAATGLLNLSIERIFYRPLRNAPRVAPLIAAIGVSFILQNFALVIAGSGDRGSPQIFPLAWRVEVGGASIALLNVAILIMALVLMAGLQLFVSRTRLGRAMRSTAQDREASMLMGVDVNQTIALTFLLGGAMAGAAGVAWGLSFGFVRQDLGFNAGLRAFTSAVLGGIGNIPGAVVGGFVIGFVQNFASSHGQSKWSEFLVFSILTLVLVFRPSGIMGQPVGDRA